MSSRRTSIRVFASALFLALAGCAPDSGASPDNAADLVLRGGKVVTLDDANPEGEAIAVRDGAVLAVGSNDEIDAYVGADTRVIELDGNLAIPGFIEGHAHFMGIGDAQMQLDLLATTSWEQIVSMVEAAVADAAPGSLIRGRGWHQEKWTSVPEGSVEGVPVHDALSAVSPNNPVILRHASGHASYANARAMEMSGITADTPDPAGGTIVRDATGDATGMFRETASDLLGPATDNADPPDRRRQAELAIEELLENGITSFQDAGSSFGTIDLLREMADDGDLDVRLYVMIRQPNQAIEARLGEYPLIGYADNRLTARAIKVTVDGALGTHGAAMLEAYSDMPETSGLLREETLAALRTTAQLAIENGFQLNVHAIGDRANREALDIYQAAFESHPDQTDSRWRIEHAQHLNAADIPRFGELGVIASMQGVHATSDGPWVPLRIGDARAEEGAYVWQKLLQSGAVVVNGTDAPVEDVSPIASYFASVSRKLADGSVFYPDQRMSRMEALRSYTLSAAYAAFEEDIKGSLVPGKLADITVLSQDILTIPEDDIPTTEVVHTIVGGEVLYSRDAVLVGR